MITTRISMELDSILTDVDVNYRSDMHTTRWQLMPRMRLVAMTTTTAAAAADNVTSSLWEQSGAQPHFQSWGPIPWSRVLLPFYRKKLDRSTQFGAVGYIITLYSSKSYVKSWGSVQILGRSGPSYPQWLHPWKHLFTELQHNQQRG